MSARRGRPGECPAKPSPRRILPGLARSAAGVAVVLLGTTGCGGPPPDAEPVGFHGEVVHLQRVPGEDEPAFDVGVRFVDPDEAEPEAQPSKA